MPLWLMFRMDLIFDNKVIKLLSTKDFKTAIDTFITKIQRVTSSLNLLQEGHLQLLQCSHYR